MRRYYVIVYDSTSRKRREVSSFSQVTGNIDITVGNENGCDAKTGSATPCNGPLDPNFKYR